MNKPFYFLCLLLIFSICLQNVLLLPYAERSAQPTEFIFLLAFLFFPFRLIKNFKASKKESYFFYAAAAYLCSNLLSSVLSEKIPSITESAGRVYLFLLLIVVYIFFTSFTREQLKQKTAFIFFITGSFLAIISLLGYILAILKVTDFFVFRITDYPYLGTIYRLRGPTFTATMLATILSCCIFFSLSDNKNVTIAKPLRIFSYSCMLVACLLTFSKTILLVVWGLFILYNFEKNRLTKTKLLLSVTGVLFLSVIATHYIFVSTDNHTYEKLKETDFISNKKVISFAGVTVLESSYVSLKKAAFFIGTQHPFIGIGAGNFNDELNSLKLADDFPVKLPNYDPHSTYAGAFAETGIAGFICLAILLWIIVRSYLQFHKLTTDRFYLCIFILLILFLIEAISTDSMNFRHFWVLIAISLAYEKVSTNKQTEVN
jgi:O-Antigen ligase